MNLIKNLSIFALVGFSSLAITSCLNSDDDNDVYTTDGYLVATKIDVNQDSIMPVNNPTNIHITITTTNSCQAFVTFKTLNGSNDSIQQIGAYGTQTNSKNCVEEIKSITKTYKFTPKKVGENYIRVWAGKDPINPSKDIYVEKILDIKAQ